MRGMHAMAGRPAAAAPAPAPAPAAASAPDLRIDLAEIGAYNFNTTGGAGGSGGAGPHELPDGTTCTLVRFGTGCSSLELTASGLEFSGGGASDYDVLIFDNGDDTAAIPVWLGWAMEFDVQQTGLAIWTSEDASDAGTVADDANCVHYSAGALNGRFALSPSNVVNKLTATGLDDGVGDVLVVRQRELSAWVRFEVGNAASLEVPDWFGAPLSQTGEGARTNAASERRYTKLRVGKDGCAGTLALKLWVGLEAP